MGGRAGRAADDGIDGLWDVATRHGLESHRDVPCSKYAVPHMRRRGWGRIVNLGVAGAYRAHGSARMSAFYAAKAGIVAFSKSLAREVGPYGITVNVVAPGVIEDPELPPADARRRKDKRLAVPRVGTGEDVANAVLFRVSEQAEFVTGDVLGVAGGWLL